MKQYFTIALSLACTALIIGLVIVKRGDNARHDTDTGAIADFSNRLDSAQIQIAIGNGTIITFSNSLDQCQSALLTFSNNLNDAQSTIALDAGQITNLNQQVAAVESENQMLSQTLGRRVADLTNQVAGLTTQLDTTQTNLNEANQQCSLLGNRLRRDVAARLVVEQKFDNSAALQAQLDYLKQNPEEKVSLESIYAGLDVEVNSNGAHVISPQ